MSERLRYQLSASVFVALVKGFDVCMLKRHGTGWMDGSFSIPAGGLDAGETIAAAAIREANEEVGVRIFPENLKYVHTLHSRTAGTAWLGHFFQATIWQGTPELRGTEKHSNLQWHSINTLPSSTIPYVQEALICIFRNEPYSAYGWA